MAVASSRASIGAGAQVTRRLLATGGDRLLLQRVLWTARGDPSAFEIEALIVYEIDRDDRVVAVVTSDPDDRQAADRELLERYLRSPDLALPPAAVEFIAANARDLARVRATLADDFVLDDHRSIGFGRIDGADAYVESLAAFFELSPDGFIGDLYEVAAAPHGRVSPASTSSTWRTSGWRARLEALSPAPRAQGERRQA
jgi:hypothetical protein